MASFEAALGPSQPRVDEDCPPARGPPEGMSWSAPGRSPEEKTPPGLPVFVWDPAGWSRRASDYPRPTISSIADTGQDDKAPGLVHHEIGAQRSPVAQQVPQDGDDFSPVEREIDVIPSFAYARRRRGM